MGPSKDHISLCICTYKRQILLERLLIELQNQITDGLFTYSIVIVDNDYAKSAKSVVESCREKTLINIDYLVESEQNIALARNKAVKNAKGDFIAFIDDDEFPVNDWLLNLYKTFYKYKVDGVLGPVKPHFDEKPPNWIVKGGFCERESFKTGTFLHWSKTRTGNVLLTKKIFKDKDDKFGPEFGRTGGEDIEFFKKMIKKGRIFVWCNEAPVFETVLSERWEKSFYLKKLIRIGGLTGEKIRKEHFRSYKHLVKVIISFIMYISVLPFSFLFGQHIFMKCLIKIVYNIGWILGFCGFVIIRYRND